MILDTVLEIAMKMRTRSPAVAPLHRKDFRTYGITIPELTCSSVSVFGKSTHAGFFSMARADKV
jgi:hypothetical protein